MLKKLLALSLVLNITCVFAHNDIGKRPVVVISIDGFSNSYLETFNPKNLTAMANSGVMAKGLKPVFPTKTFPNHLSIATGNYPAHHGIIHNYFYSPVLDSVYTKGAGKLEPTWLRTLPIWTLAEQQNIKTGVYFWPESETKKDGLLPSYYFSYNDSVPNNERVNQIIEWLKLPEKQRPQLVMAYFSTVDKAGHSFGPNSKELEEAIVDIDNTIGLLTTRLNDELAHDVDLIVVSDHGMDTLTTDFIDINNLFVKNANLKVIDGQTQLYVYSEDEKLLNGYYKKLMESANNRYQVFLKGSYPKHWQMNADLDVIPDMILDANLPYTFSSTMQGKNLGVHGYDPLKGKYVDGIFIAKGPSFHKKMTINSFENIHVFPLLSKLLGLENTENIDGSIEVLNPILINKDD